MPSKDWWSSLFATIDGKRPQEFAEFLTHDGEFRFGSQPAVHGQGCGRACVRLLKRMAFRDLKAHRFWLDVKALNMRALALYASEGYVEEGRLRESVRISTPSGDGFDSLIVMSMLEGEYQVRVAQGVE